MAGEFKAYYGTYTPEMNLGDFHMHSSISDGILSPEALVRKAAKQGLHTISITDHNSISGGLRGQAYALEHRLGVRVLVGSEITSKDGHIVGINLVRNIKPGASAEETIDRIHDQGGLAIAVHPEQPDAGGLSYRTLDALYQKGKGCDALEVHNANSYRARRGLGERVYRYDINQQALDFHRNHGIDAAVVGGSDSHGLALAHAATAFPGDLIEAAIQNRTTAAVVSSAIDRGILADGAIQVYTSHVRGKIRGKLLAK